LSIFEIPKILCSKIFGKKNKLGKGLKEKAISGEIYISKQLKEPYGKYIFQNNLKNFRSHTKAQHFRQQIRPYSRALQSNTY
jgi:hypothetical protein